MAEQKVMAKRIFRSHELRANNPHRTRCGRNPHHVLIAPSAYSVDCSTCLWLRHVTNARFFRAPDWKFS